MTLKPKTKIIARCAAKLNLTFEILGELPGGYHEVETLLQSIDLEDELAFWVEPGGSKIVFAYQSEVSGDFPLTESNLIAKAIRKFQEAVPSAGNHTVHVDVFKRIPIGAGVAGGSANAAAALLAMNAHFGRPLTEAELLEIGTTLGADVPFAICGGTKIGRHRGDKLEDLENQQKLFFTIIKPRHLSVSTVWAYNEFDSYVNSQSGSEVPTEQKDKGTRTHLCAEAIRTADLAALSDSLYNDLEKVVFNKHPKLKSLRERLLELGAWACRMSGSGPTLYAVTADREQGHYLRRKLRVDELKGASWTLSGSSDNGEQGSLGPLDIWIAESIDYGARLISQNKGG